MPKAWYRLLFTFLLALPLAANTVAQGAKTQKQRSSEPKSEERLIQEVRHQLVMLPYYSVFDNLSFFVEGGTVTILGQVVRPSLKSDAEGTVKRIEGVNRVINKIEVLPVSPNDDQLRLALYRSIYGHTVLQHYSLQAAPPMHIIVKNGHTTLVGMVANETDKNIAGLQANGVSGVFSVKNELQVEGRKK